MSYPLSPETHPSLPGRKKTTSSAAQEGIAAIAVAAPGIAAVSDAKGSDSGDGQNAESELTESGRRKRKDTGKPREKGRPWTAEEEAKFLEGLESYGRDWKAIGSFMGSRDHRAVASHAQKHFIKLCLSGQELPKKVAESGLGYTLSGKLLDPHSAAARAYGFRPELLQSECMLRDWMLGSSCLCARAKSWTRPSLVQASQLENPCHSMFATQCVTYLSFLWHTAPCVAESELHELACHGIALSQLFSSKLPPATQTCSRVPALGLLGLNLSRQPRHPRCIPQGCHFISQLHAHA
jgi:SHAQKYF class myb-like DNA-binding protein